MRVCKTEGPVNIIGLQRQLLIVVVDRSVAFAGYEEEDCCYSGRKQTSHCG